MLMHHSLESAQSRLNSENHWLVNGSFLLRESFRKNHLFSVTSLWCTFVNTFLVVHPTHILVHPRVHLAHQLMSTALSDHMISDRNYCRLLIEQKESVSVCIKMC